MVYDITDFRQFLNKKHLSDKAYIFPVERMLSNIKEITQEEINSYFSQCYESFSPAYFNQTWFAVNKYFKFKKIHLELPDRAKKIKNNVPRKILTESDLENIKAQCPKIFRKYLRVQALLDFMFYTGVRKSEVYTLARRDINLDANKANIFIRKTKQQQEFCFAESTKYLLIKYFESEDEEENAFNLSQYEVDYIFSMLKQKTEYTWIYPHAMKKSAISNMFKIGLRIQEISDVVGISPRTAETHYLFTQKSDSQKKYQEILNNR